MYSTSHRHCSGFSIVELMVALAVSAFLLVGVVQVFVGSKQTFNAVEEVSRMQENGRFVTELIARVTRTAGYSGCSTGIGPLTNTLNTPGSVEFDFGTGVGGFEANNSGPGDTVTITAENPGASGTWAGGTVPGTVSALAIPGSDMLVVRGPSGDDVPIAKSNNSAQLFAKLTATVADGCPGPADKLSGICPEDILLVTDCRKSRVFQATGLQETSNNPCSPTNKCVNITHSGSLNNPGNALTSWGGSSAPEAEQFGADSEIVRIQSTMFFVGVGADGTPSLYQRINGGAAQELVSGVETMQVLYGEDTDDDGVADLYRTADSVVDFVQVVSLRVSLLLRTDNPISPDINSQTYLLNGTTAAFATTIDPFNDRRGRYVFTSTVKLRNRGA